MGVPQPADAEPAIAEHGEVPDFGPTFRAHGPYVWRLLRRLGVADADADDLCQEVFLVLHRRWAELDTSRSLRPWIYGVAVRVAGEHRRRNRTSKVALGEHVEVVDAEQDDAVEQRQARDLLRCAIERLSDSKREIFVLHELEELSMREIAEALSCPLQTAYSRLHAARSEVKSFFEKMQAKGGKAT